MTSACMCKYLDENGNQTVYVGADSKGFSHQGSIDDALKIFKFGKKYTFVFSGHNTLPVLLGTLIESINFDVYNFDQLIQKIFVIAKGLTKYLNISECQEKKSIIPLNSVILITDGKEIAEIRPDKILRSDKDNLDIFVVGVEINICKESLMSSTEKDPIARIFHAIEKVSKLSPDLVGGKIHVFDVNKNNKDVSIVGKMQEALKKIANLVPNRTFVDYCNGCMAAVDMIDQIIFTAKDALKGSNE